MKLPVPLTLTLSLTLALTTLTITTTATTPSKVTRQIRQPTANLFEVLDDKDYIPNHRCVNIGSTTSTTISNHLPESRYVVYTTRRPPWRYTLFRPSRIRNTTEYTLFASQRRRNNIKLRLVVDDTSTYSVTLGFAVACGRRVRAFDIKVNGARDVFPITKCKFATFHTTDNVVPNGNGIIDVRVSKGRRRGGMASLSTLCVTRTASLVRRPDATSCSNDSCFVFDGQVQSDILFFNFTSAPACDAIPSVTVPLPGLPAADRSLERIIVTWWASVATPRDVTTPPSINVNGIGLVANYVENLTLDSATSPLSGHYYSAAADATAIVGDGGASGEVILSNATFDAEPACSILFGGLAGAIVTLTSTPDTQGITKRTVICTDHFLPATTDPTSEVHCLIPSLAHLETRVAFYVLGINMENVLLRVSRIEDGGTVVGGGTDDVVLRDRIFGFVHPEDFILSADAGKTTSGIRFTFEFPVMYYLASVPFKMVVQTLTEVADSA